MVGAPLSGRGLFALSLERPMTDRPFRKSIRLPLEAYQDSGRVSHVVVHAFRACTPFRVEGVATAVWDVVLQQNARHEARLFAACLMPDHLHMLASPRQRDLVRWLNALKSFSTTAARTAGWSGPLWQPSFYDRALREDEFDSALAYVWNNPLAAGISTDSGAWPRLGVWLDSDR